MNLYSVYTDYKSELMYLYSVYTDYKSELIKSKKDMLSRLI